MTSIIWREERKNGVGLSHQVTQAEYDAIRRQRDELERAITNAGLCIGSEFAGDLRRMVEFLIEEAKRPLPRRILEAEAQRDELLTALKSIVEYCDGPYSDIHLPTARLLTWRKVIDEVEATR